VLTQGKPTVQGSENTTQQVEIEYEQAKKDNYYYRGGANLGPCWTFDQFHFLPNTRYEFRGLFDRREDAKLFLCWMNPRLLDAFFGQGTLFLPGFTQLSALR
jgi:hypothetical protein